MKRDGIANFIIRLIIKIMLFIVRLLEEQIYPFRRFVQYLDQITGMEFYLDWLQSVRLVNVAGNYPLEEQI